MGRAGSRKDTVTPLLELHGKRGAQVSVPASVGWWTLRTDPCIVFALLVVFCGMPVTWLVKQVRSAARGYMEAVDNVLELEREASRLYVVGREHEAIGVLRSAARSSRVALACLSEPAWVPFLGQRLAASIHTVYKGDSVTWLSASTHGSLGSCLLSLGDFTDFREAAASLAQAQSLYGDVSIRCSDKRQRSITKTSKMPSSVQRQAVGTPMESVVSEALHTYHTLPGCSHGESHRTKTDGLLAPYVDNNIGVMLYTYGREKQALAEMASASRLADSLLQMDAAAVQSMHRPDTAANATLFDVHPDEANNAPPLPQELLDVGRTVGTGVAHLKLAPGAGWLSPLFLSHHVPSMLKPDEDISAEAAVRQTRRLLRKALTSKCDIMMMEAQGLHHGPNVENIAEILRELCHREILRPTAPAASDKPRRELALLSPVYLALDRAWLEKEGHVRLLTAIGIALSTLWQQGAGGTSRINDDLQQLATKCLETAVDLVDPSKGTHRVPMARRAKAHAGLAFHLTAVAERSTNAAEREHVRKVAAFHLVQRAMRLQRMAVAAQDRRDMALYVVQAAQANMAGKGAAAKELKRLHRIEQIGIHPARRLLEQVSQGKPVSLPSATQAAWGTVSPECVADVYAAVAAILKSVHSESSTR